MKFPRSLPKGFWTDPRYGAVCWPLTTGLALYAGNIWFGVFAAFWAGASIQRCLDRYVEP